MLHLCFVYVLFVFRLYFFNVCQNPKILFSQNKILDFCLTQVLRKQSVCQTQVKHRANIVSHNSAHLQRRWKHVRDSWDTWLPEGFVDSFVFCWWVVLCFIVDSLAFCLWWVSDVFMIHLCLLLCCVYVVLCWFFTSLVYVRLLASDLVPIDEALWVYLTYHANILQMLMWNQWKTLKIPWNFLLLNGCGWTYMILTYVTLLANSFRLTANPPGKPNMLHQPFISLEFPTSPDMLQLHLSMSRLIIAYCNIRFDVLIL